MKTRTKLITNSMQVMGLGVSMPTFAAASQNLDQQLLDGTGMSSVKLLAERPAGAGRHSGAGISFNSLDANSDGKISLQEFIDNAPAMGRPAEQIFNRVDSDDDGFINVGEFENRKQGRGRPS